MPELFETVQLLNDCDGWNMSLSGSDAVVSRGSCGILVDKNSAFPGIWTIEFPPSSTDCVLLVETDEQNFVVCAARHDAIAGDLSSIADEAPD